MLSAWRRPDLELTAIIEPAAKLGATDEDPDRLAMYRFGVETMEENQIRVLTTADMSSRGRNRSPRTARLTVCQGLQAV